MGLSVPWLGGGCELIGFVFTFGFYLYFDVIILALSGMFYASLFSIKV
jgi:hypothetical protein